MIYVVGTESCWLKGSRQPFVKIGVTIDLRKRLGQFQTDNPLVLKVHYLFNGEREREQELHAMFAHWHYRAEWFRTWVGVRALQPFLDDEWRSHELSQIVSNRGVVS